MNLCINLIPRSVHSNYFNPIRTSGIKQNGCESIIGMISMKTTKQISQVEEKPFTSSLNIWLEACCRKRWGRAEELLPPHHHPISQLIRGHFIKKRRRNRYSPPRCFLHDKNFHVVGNFKSALTTSPQT
jgi:hypothetical protein